MPHSAERLRSRIQSVAAAAASATGIFRFMAVATGNEYGLFINGETVEPASGELRDLVEPATGEPLGRSAMAGEADVDRAVAAARAAVDGAWGRTPPTERSRLLHALADAIHAEPQGAGRARVAQRRQGDLVGQGRGRRRGRELPLLRVGVGSIGGRSNPVGGSLLTYSLKEPVGVAAQIVPWNYPLLMSVWKLSPALAAGCAVVLKPDPQTPLSVLRVAELATRGRLPRGRDQHRSRRRPGDRRVSRHASRCRQGRVHRLDQDGRRDHAALLRPDQAAHARARRQEPEPRVRRRRARRRDPELGVVDLLLGRTELRGALARARRSLALRRVRVAFRRLREADSRRRPARRGDADGLAHLDCASRPRARLRRARREGRRGGRRRRRVRRRQGRVLPADRACEASTTRWRLRRRRSSAPSSR